MGSHSAKVVDTTRAKIFSTDVCEMARLFVTEEWVSASLEQVFGFFADPRNLPLISQPRAGARLVSLTLRPPLDGTNMEFMAGPGSEIVISVRMLPWLPFRTRWTARITEFEYGIRYFRDEQVSGPFRLWRHQHEFEPVERSGYAGTVVRDRVEYEVGYGPLGAVAEILFVRRILKQMFAWRYGATERLLSTTN